MPPAKHLISSRLPTKLIINTTKLSPNLTFRETVWNIFQICWGRIFSSWSHKNLLLCVVCTALNLYNIGIRNQTKKTNHHYLCFQSHNFRIKQSMLWHNSREQKGNNVLQVFAKGELWQERVGVEWNEKMGQWGEGRGVRNYFLGSIYLRTEK